MKLISKSILCLGRLLKLFRNDNEIYNTKHLKHTQELESIFYQTLSDIPETPTQSKHQLKETLNKYSKAESGLTSVLVLTVFFGVAAQTIPENEKQTILLLIPTFLSTCFIFYYSEKLIKLKPQLDALLA